MNYKQTFFQALFIFCEERNIDPAYLARSSGFDLRDLYSECNFTLTDPETETLWKNIVKLSNNEAIGLQFGYTMQVAALNLVGQVILTSNTVRDALMMVSSLLHLFTDLYTMHIEEGEKTFKISYTRNERHKTLNNANHQMGDFLTAFTLHELRGLLVKRPKPILVTLPTYNKAFANQYGEILQGPVRKGDRYLLEFDNAYLDTKIITANYGLQKTFLDQIPLLKERVSNKGAFATAIYNYLFSNSYLYTLSMESVANNFNISVRTLQRKLKEEHLTYFELVEDVRKSLAIQYLRNDFMSIKEIADTLGYAEVSGFIRAFKRWTNKSPTAFKREYYM